MGPTGVGDGVAAWEPRLKRPKEEIFDGPPVLPLDFFKVGQVSTGLGLSLDNPNFNLASSSGESSTAFNLSPPVMGDAFDREMQRMDAEMDGFIRFQADRLRKSILEKVQAKQIHTLASFEEKFRHKIQEKEAEIQEMTKRNMELEEQFKKLCHETGMWQQQAKDNEDQITALRLKFQQVYAQNQNNKREGCGDSEVDSVSCSKAGINLRQLKESKKESMACKVCGVNETCMLLLPCRHLCLCKECEVKLNFCPVCQSSKYFGVEVYM